MVNILLPTDFSEFAQKAADYVIDLFNGYPTNLYLYHAYGTPHSGGSMLISIDDILYKEAREEMARELARIKKRGTENIELHERLINGQLLHSVDEIIANHDIHFVVMGTKGATGISGKLFGSQTVSMVRKAKVPVLAVPHSARHFGHDDFKLVFGSDLKEFQSPEKLNFFLKQVKAAGGPDTLKIMHISPEPSDVSEQTKSYFDRVLPDVAKSYHNMIDTSIMKGIQAFIEQFPPDLLILVLRKNSLINRLMGDSVTQNLAILAPVPLLILPG